MASDAPTTLPPSSTLMASTSTSDTGPSTSKHPILMTPSASSTPAKKKKKEKPEKGHKTSNGPGLLPDRLPPVWVDPNRLLVRIIDAGILPVVITIVPLSVMGTIHLVEAVRLHVPRHNNFILLHHI
ncbi:UNVERIFIED_CONTAM: hypothetical protein K2H54_054474 [Gekko kuhli]